MDIGLDQTGSLSQQQLASAWSTALPPFPDPTDPGPLEHLQEILVLFSFKKFWKIDIIVFSFVFYKYYLIMD
jgi:hypothetical protein